MPHTIVFNPTDQPVVIDADGHTVAGRDWAAVDTATAEVDHALENGRLVTVDADRDLEGTDDRYRAAVEQLKTTSSRGKRSRTSDDKQEG